MSIVLDQSVSEEPNPRQDSKALRLARYLRAFVGLRSTMVHDVDTYETVLWFSEMPQEPECQSPAWHDNGETGIPWLEVHKQQFPTPPEPPEAVLPWIDQDALRRATAEMPPLRPTILTPDLTAEVDDGDDPPLITEDLIQRPEISYAYEHYRPTWEAWSAESRRRARIQAVYAELFRMHTQVRKQGEVIELVLGLGLLDWRSPAKGQPGPIRRHLVTARVDLSFDPLTGMIRLDGAADGAQLRLEDDMLEAELRPDRDHYASVGEQLRAIGDEVWDDARMHTALKSWAAALHADAQWSADLTPAPNGNGRPVVSFAPALILRKRTQVGMVRVYDALIDQLSRDDADVPRGWGGLVDDDDDDDYHDGGGWAPSTEATAQPLQDAHELYVPLPANREQRRIVEAIERKRGVLVQGPPGTGKSHTIANLVCHLLATGKRVLITAETSRALRVLKDKLPAEIQPLCVSILGHGGDAFSELNTAVLGISTRQAAYRPGAYDDRIAEIDGELKAARRVLAEIDTELRTLREDETCPQSLGNGAYRGTASAIAERVARERARFGWLQVPRAAPHDPPVTGADVAAWLRIRRSYDEDAIARATRQILPSERLPTPVEFGHAVAAEREAGAAVEPFAGRRRHAAYVPITALRADARTELGTALRGLEEQRKTLHRYAYDWLTEALTAALGGRSALWHALLQRSQELLAPIGQVLDRLGAASVFIPADRAAPAVHADVMAMIAHLQAGGHWTRWGVWTPKVVKERTYLRDQVTVDGQPADTPERLQVVGHYLDLIGTLEALERAWADHGGLPAGADLRIRFAGIQELVDTLDKALAYAWACLEQGRGLRAATPPIPEPNWITGQAHEWLALIELAAIEERHHLATRQVTACLSDLKAIRDFHDAHPIIGSLVKAIEERDVTAYSQAHTEVRRIEHTRQAQQQRQQIEMALEAAVPGLMHAVAVSMHDAAWDERFNHWEEAWHWAIAENWLQKRTDRRYQEQCWRRRHDTEKAIGRLLAAAASLQAWTHFFKRLSPREAAALKSWREAVKAMGKGTGRSAKMAWLQREARGYMDQCREAIPVWIMPRYLVAEMVNPVPGRYDIVIVDEASQLGIESLFLFYLAKKMVVVGDDQQISPSGVGIADEDLAGLRHHYLEGIPYRAVLSAQSSLYSHAKIRFGQTIVLREHFRCMPEIIQFSNDLCYACHGTPLDPLRVYPAIRLKPLVVRHVPEGYRTGSPQHAVNEPEADAIVAQIIACIDDARYAGRTMGVISLQGEAQARLIERKLLERLEPEVIEARRLICGDAYAFQGDERHVIFLSLVAAPNARIGSLADESARQRFNVAVSRAQDQLWLFHSVTLDVLSPTCMRSRLLSYMLNPGRMATEEQDHHFESEFERGVFQVITGRGFRVRTQVCIGDPTNHRYRIDLVVEGMQGRLAVECDGDQWHGPDRYEQDMARQRDLERAGWQFVRVRGSEFYRDPTKALEPLWAELDRLGIKPGGIDDVAGEPPLPADRQPMAHQVAEEIMPREPWPSDTHRNRHATDHVYLPNTGDDPPGGDGMSAPEILPRARNLPFATYAAYDGPTGEDPRTGSTGAVAQGLCRIIAVEGPMMAKRAYDMYLQGCGIKRMGHELKNAMNKALAEAIRQGRILSEDERGKRGLLFSVVRVKEDPPIRLRTRGPRTFQEIPPSEVQAVATYLAKRYHLTPGSEEHLRAVLECFELKRLTAPLRATLREILGKRYPYVDDFLRDVDEEPYQPAHSVR